MKPVATLAWDDGVLKTATPNLPPLSWLRPGDLAEARLNCDPTPDDLDVRNGCDLLDAAFKVVPFVREPLPEPSFGDGVTPPAQDAFRLFLGTNVAEKADDFKVLRGEPDEFIVCVRRYRDVWKVGAFTVEPITLTVRFEDVWRLLPENARFTEYLVEVVRDPNAKDSAAAQSARIIREVFPGIAPDARICLDLAAGGGFTLAFWPVVSK